MILILLLVASAWAGPNCRYGDWDEWGTCERSSICPRPLGVSQQSFAPSGRNGEGRITGERMMAYKDALWSVPNQRRNEKQSVVGARVACTGGYAGDYRCQNVDMMSFLSLDALGGSGTEADSGRGNDIWGWTDPTNNDEYAVMGMDDGTSFVRMTDPENPVVVAFLPTATIPSNWRDMKVVNNHAFIVSEAAGHGMQVFDLTRLRGQTDLGDVAEDVWYTNFGNAHNIISNPASNTVFVVGATNGDQEACLGGLHMIDVSQPANPQFAGCFADDGYVHDAECNMYTGPDTRYSGREVCYCYNEDQLAIVDVTDKANPSYISTSGYPGSAYTHQGWITIDHTTLLLDDEQDESRSFDGNTITYMWNVRDLSNPTLMNTYVAAHGAIDHNQYIKGDLTYQSNYEVGLRILRIDQANYDLSEVAFFDNDDSSDGGLVSFQGSWSNYPYFASGNIPLTSIELGLFIVRPNQAAMEADYQAGKNGEQLRTRALVSGTDEQCPAVNEYRKCTPASC